MALRFIIEFVPKGEKYIFARKLENVNFALTPDSQIGGYAIKQLGLAPRASYPDGSPRFDICAFVLRNKADAASLMEGQEVLLEHVEVIKQGGGEA
jgi:hypothetical protein